MCNLRIREHRSIDVIALEANAGVSEFIVTALHCFAKSELSTVAAFGRMYEL
jgi:hypothetical protein